MGKFSEKKLMRTLTMALVAAAYYTGIFQQTESSISKAWTSLDLKVIYSVFFVYSCKIFENPSRAFAGVHVSFVSSSVNTIIITDLFSFHSFFVVFSYLRLYLDSNTAVAFTNLIKFNTSRMTLKIIYFRKFLKVILHIMVYNFLFTKIPFLPLPSS